MNADLRAKVRGWLTPIHWRDGLMAAPALIVILLVGIAMDLQVHAVVAAGAALSVGFGASRTFFSLRCGATIAAALGTAAAAMAGSLLGGHELPYLIGCAVLAGGNAAFATRDQTVWWLALQVAIAFLIAGHFPRTLAQATLRAELVLPGGAIQIAIVMTLDRIIPYDRRTPPPPNAAASEPIAPFVIRAAICVPLALVVARSMHIEYEY